MSKEEGLIHYENLEAKTLILLISIAEVKLQI